MTCIACAIGTALGPTVGGLLIAQIGWRAIFLVQVPLGLLGLWMVYRSLPADRARVPGAGGLDWRSGWATFDRVLGARLANTAS